MAIYSIVFFNILTQISQKGYRILVSLYALELGANAFGVGVLISLQSVFPIFLAIYAGMAADRLGARLPMLFGSVGLALGLLLPFLFPCLPMLYLTAPIIGASGTVFLISYQNLIGDMGAADQRKRNFGIMSLGTAASGFFGSLATGFLIDTLGHISTFVYLSLNATVSGFVLFFLSKRIAPSRKPSKDRKQGSLISLIKNESLRRVLITSGVVVAGVHLYSFYFPIFGHTIGLSASSIGIILSAYAAAMFVVRMIMSITVKKYNEESVLTFCLLMAGATYIMFPFFRNVIVLVLISFLLGIGLGCGQPLTIVMTFNRAPDGRSGEVLGLRHSGNRIILMTVPLVFGFVGATFGFMAVFWSSALFLIGGGGINMYREQQEAARNEVT